MLKNINERELLFYDIEVFKEDTLIVFKKRDKSTYKIMHNDFSGLNNIVDEFTLVGYNNYYYDDKIITLLMNGYDHSSMKRFSDQIIKEDYRVYVNKRIQSLDAFQQISVARPGLKRIQANMGKSIVESEIDFNINRKLTPSEIQETIHYCSHDVDTTIDIYDMREDTYFKTKFELVDLLGGNIRWNTTTITGNAFGLTHKLFTPVIDHDINKLLPPELKDHFKKASDMNYKQYLYKEGKGRKFTFDLYGNTIDIGIGGAHGTNQDLSNIKLENIRCLDVASMYPNIMINKKLLGEHTSKYQGILNTRMDLKRAGKKAEQLVYKLILNSLYGLLGSQYSACYDPNRQVSTCLMGQQYIIYLAKILYENGMQIVQINTDGVFFVENGNSEKCKKLFEERTGLDLEYDDYDIMFQKDVNNYVASDNGNFKLKGGFVNKYKGNNFFANNSLSIIDIMLVDKIIKGTPFHETIQTHKDDYIYFQQVCSVTHKFIGTVDDKGNEHGKHNRLFATKDGLSELKKVKIVDGEKRYILFPDLPEKFTIFNGDLNECDLELDYNYYIRLAQKKYDKFKGV